MKTKFREPKLEESGEDVGAKAPATEPWNPESAPDHPSKHGMLGVAKLKKGFELRWVRHDSIDRRKNQGYTLAAPEDFDATPDENGMIRRNEMVLMVVKQEVYDQRRKEIAKTTETQATAPRNQFLREREVASRQSGHDLSDKDETE